MGPVVRPRLSLPAAGPSPLDRPAHLRMAGLAGCPDHTSKCLGLLAWGPGSCSSTEMLGPWALCSALLGPQRFQELCVQLQGDTQDRHSDPGTGCGLQRDRAHLCWWPRTPRGFSVPSASQTSPQLAEPICLGPLPCSGSGVTGRVKVGEDPSLQTPGLRRLSPACPPPVRKRIPLWHGRIYDARVLLWLPGGLQASCWPCSCRKRELHIHLEPELAYALSLSLPLILSLDLASVTQADCVWSGLSAKGRQPKNRLGRGRACLWAPRQLPPTGCSPASRPGEARPVEPTLAARASAGPAQLPRELQQEGPGSPPTHPQRYPVQPASEGGHPISSP